MLDREKSFNIIVNIFNELQLKYIFRFFLFKFEINEKALAYQYFDNMLFLLKCSHV